MAHFIPLILLLTIPAKQQEPTHGQLFLKSRLSEDLYQSQGLAHRAHGVPVTDSTVFDIASLNKSFIANLVLQAAGEGRWNRGTSLNDLLARYKFDARFHEGITLHQMLCHRSGLADYGDLDAQWKDANFRSFKRQHFSNPEYLDFIAKQKHREPDAQFYYSNFAYHILAILLEAEYQMDFDRLLQEKIAIPLAMHHTSAPMDRREVLKNRARAYEFDEASHSFRANDYIDLSLGRRIYSNAQDLMLWLEAKGGTSLLPDSLAAQVLQNQVGDLDPEMSYGYGWVSFPAEASFKMGDLDLDQAYYIHGGSTEGFQSLAISVNGGETNLVLLSNHGNGKALFERAQQLLKNIYD